MMVNPDRDQLQSKIIEQRREYLLGNITKIDFCSKLKKLGLTQQEIEDELKGLILIEDNYD